MSTTLFKTVCIIGLWMLCYYYDYCFLLEWFSSCLLESECLRCWLIFLLTIKICDVVAVAKILNATLVIPHLEVNPVWQDSRYLMSKLSWQLMLHSSFLRKGVPFIIQSCLFRQLICWHIWCGTLYLFLARWNFNS